MAPSPPGEVPGERGETRGATEWAERDRIVATTAIRKLPNSYFISVVQVCGAKGPPVGPRDVDDCWAFTKAAGQVRGRPFRGGDARHEQRRPPESLLQSIGEDLLQICCRGSHWKK